jgi:hypothetical protein
MKKQIPSIQPYFTNVIPYLARAGQKLPAIFILSTLSLILGATALQGAILVTFVESNGDVTASFSGSLDLVGLTRVGDDNAGYAVTFNTVRFRILEARGSDSYSGGVSTASGLNSSPDVFKITEDFGYYENNSFYVPQATALNSVYTIAGGQSLEWTGKTLTSIGLSALTTTPFAVWNNPNASGTDGSFQFVVGTVPEPASTVWFISAFFALLVFSRRRR